MPISATGRPKHARARQGGFTLVELLIVLTIVGLMSATVVIAMPDPRGSVVSEAERFAARAKAAQDRAIIDARAVSVRLSAEGYGFDARRGEQWQPLDRRPFTNYAWGEGVQASAEPATSRIVFDSTGAAEPVRLTLSRANEQALVAIGADGKIDVER